MCDFLFVQPVVELPLVMEDRSLIQW